MVTIRHVALLKGNLKDRIRELNGDITHEESWYADHREVKAEEVEAYFPQLNDIDCYTEDGIPVDELDDLVDDTAWTVDCTHDIENGGVHFLREFDG